MRLDGTNIAVTGAARGIGRGRRPLDVSEDVCRSIVDVDALGVFIGRQDAARQMIRQDGGGRIIRTASIASRRS